MSRLNQQNSLNYGNKETHIFTEFATIAKESTQKEVLAAIQGIQINVGDIIVGDITVESSDTTTHEKLDTINTTLENGINTTVDCDKINLVETADIATKKALVTASAIYGYSPNGGVVENITFSNSAYIGDESVKNRLDVSTVILDPTNDKITKIAEINAVLLNGTPGLVCSSVLMATNENDETSRLLMTADNKLKVESNLITGFATEETLSALNDKINADTENTSAIQVQIKNTSITVDGSVDVPLITGYATEETISSLNDKINNDDLLSEAIQVSIKNTTVGIAGSVNVTEGSVQVTDLPYITAENNSFLAFGSHDGQNKAIKTTAEGRVETVLFNEIGDALTSAQLAVDRFGLDTLSVLYYRDDNSILQEMNHTGGDLNVNVTNGLTIDSGSVEVTGSVTAACSGSITIQGNDGTAIPKTIACDADGKLNVNAAVTGSVSAACTGTVSVQGTDGTTAKTLACDTDGKLNVNAAVTGSVSAACTGTVTIQGTDGTTAKTLACDTDGKLNVNAAVTGSVSAACTGTVTIQGTDGTTAKTLSCDTDGKLNTLVTGSVSAACTGTVSVQGVYNNTAKTLSCDTDGKLNVNATFGAASILVQGSDYEADPTNRDLYVDVNGYTTTNVITNVHENILVGWDENSKLRNLSTGSTAWSITNPYSTEQDGWVVSVPVTTGPTSSASLMWYNNGNWGTNLYNQQYNFTFADIDIWYMIISNYNCDSTNNFPRVRIYSQATGSGDFAPGYYKSRWEYIIDTSQFTNNGSNVMIYTGNLARVKANDTECPRVAYTLNNTQGSHQATESIAHIEFFSEPDSTTNQHNVIEGAIYVKSKGLINYYFTNNNKSKAELASQKLSSLTFTTGSLDVNLKKVDVTSVPVEIKTTGNTIKIDSSNNTIKIDQNSTNNYIKVTDGTNVATVTTPTNETTIKGLDTNAYLLVKNLTAGTNTYLTSSIPTNTDFFQSQALDVNITNTTTSNWQENKGINMYQIYPRVKTYSLSGISSAAGINTMLANYATSTTFSFTSWGRQAPKTFYASLTAGGSTKYLYFEYVDLNGDIQTSPVKIIGSATGTTVLLSNIIGINRFYWAGLANGGANNQAFGTADNMYVSTTSGSTTPSYYGGFYYGNWNSTYTCPNGKVAVLKAFSFYASSAIDLFGFICDANGSRRIVLNVINASNFIYQTPELQIYPGETLFFGTGNNATVTNKQIFAQIYQYDV